MANYNRSLPEDEIQAYLAQAKQGTAGVNPRAQTLARSSNPRTSRLGQKLVEQQFDANRDTADDMAREQEKAAREAEQAAKESAREAKAAAREKAKAEREAQARNVRAAEAQGAKIETDIETGRRTVATHADGAPVFESGPIGPVKQIGTVGTAIQGEDGKPQVVPDTSIMMGGGGDGAIGAAGTEQNAVFGQEVRDNRGNVSIVEPKIETDKKTGVQTFDQKNEVTGRTDQKFAGIDWQQREIAGRLENIDREKTVIDQRDNTVKQAKARFEPQWEPVKKEFDALDKELTNYPQTFRRNEKTGKMEKIDPKTDSAIPYDPRELVVWEKERDSLKAKHEAAKAKHDQMFPMAENLNRNEREIEQKRLELEAERLKLENGLPDEANGLAKLLAKTGGDGVTRDQADAALLTELGLDPAGYDLGSETLGKADPSKPADPAPVDANNAPANSSQPAVDVNETPVGETQPGLSRTDETQPPPASPAASPAPPAEEKPLVPTDDPLKADLFAKSFQGLADPSQFTVRDDLSGETFKTIQRNGQTVGAVQLSGGAPIVVLNAGPNEDLKGIATLGGTQGIPVYLADGERMPLGKEAAWATESFRIANQAMALPFGFNEMLEQPGTVSPLADIEGQLKAVGADLPSIIAKVKRGEISMQVGESLAQGIYKETLQATDPLKPETVKAFLEENPDIRQKWDSSDKGAAAQNEVTQGFVSDWYAKNQHKPGVTWGMMETARKYHAKNKGFGETVKGVGGILADAGGSMIGLLAAYPTLAGMGIYSGMSDDEAVDSATSEMLTQRGRANKNFIRGLEANRKKWFTPEGKQRISKMEKAAQDLRSFNTTRDVYPDGVNDPRWQAGMKERIEALTDATFELHASNAEDGWEMTRDDVDPNKNKVLKASLGEYLETGDPAMWEQFSRRLLLDKGSLQSEQYNQDLTEGRGRFASAVIGGAVASDFETVVEILSTVLTVGAAKAITIGGKVLKGAEGAATLTRGARIARFGEQVAKDFHKLGMVEDTLAKPASMIGKARNVTVKGIKAGTVNAASEGTEELVAGFGDPNATQASLAEQFAVGALAGLVLAPVMVAPTMAATNSRENYKRGKQADALVDAYNKAGRNTEGFQPITREQAIAAIQIANNPARSAAVEKLQAAKTELQLAQSELAGTQAGLKSVQAEGKNLTAPVPGDQNADSTARAESLRAWQESNAEQERTAQGKVENAASRFSRALSGYAQATGELSNILATALDITGSTKGMKPAEAAKVNGLAKVAFGRPDLLTGSERSSIAGLKTQDGLPYFEAGPTGTEILTDAGRAEVQANYPILGGKIATPESMALFEAKLAQAAQPSPTATNEQDSQGQAGAQAAQTNPQPSPANPQASGGSGGSGGSVPGTATGAAPQAGTPGAAVEAGIYEAARQQDPTLPEIPAAVSAAFAAGQSVSVSMQKASGIDVPEGYTRQGNVWTPPQSSTPQNVANPANPLQAARQVAEQVKAAVEKAMPKLKGRISITEDDANTGGADIDIQTGNIRLTLPDIQRSITRAGGDAAAVADYLSNLVARHEATHVVQVQVLRAEWEAAGSPGTFLDYFDRFYGDLAKDLLTPEAIEAARQIYGEEAWDRIQSDSQKAAEFVRMLVEAKLDGNTEAFSELFRAVKTQGAKSKLANLIREAVEILTGMKLSPAAEAHVAKLRELYAELSAAPVQKTAPKPQKKAEFAGNSAKTGKFTKGTTVRSDIYKREGDIILTSEAREGPNGTEYEAYFSGTARVGTIQEKHITSTVKAPAITDADASNPLRITGLAIKAALEKFPRLGGKLRQELEDAADDVTDALEALPAGERAQAAETAIADRINLIADREAERTGKKREEIIEGFRAVAGKRAAKQAASIEQAVLGSEAPEIPAGKAEKRDTPNSEMTVDVVSTYLDMDQLVGSSDPLFPGGALQPRNRAGQASQNQREEMVQNIRDKENQHRRYLEGATTDSGRMVVAPLFGADGKQMTNEAGKPLFYVISGNGRRNALREAANRNVSGKVMKGFRETAAAEGIDVEGMTLPTPVSIFVPKSAKEAIDLAEFSNRDAQLSVSNTEQANRDAASIDKGNILKLWEPDTNGDAGAASNRDFVKAFVRVTGDEGIVDNRGNLTDEGAQRIERAMVALLLGPEQAPLLEILFNRSGALGLRAILGGIASQAGSLVRVSQQKPEFDIAPLLSKALEIAAQAKQSLVNGEIRSIGEFFDQANLFEDTVSSPERQLARAMVESRSRKNILEILEIYRRGAEAVDTGTMSMFAEAETTREDLILKALEARPIEQVIAEVEAEFGAKADLAAKLKLAIPGVKKFDPGQRRDFVAAVNAEVERLRSGGISAEEWQRLNPDALSAKAALFQRFLDSHTPETIQGGFNRLLSRPVQAVLGSSPATARDYLDAIKNVFRENLGPDTDLKAVPDINTSPAEMLREIRQLVGITIKGMQASRPMASLGSSPSPENISPDTPIEVVDTKTGEVVWRGTYAQRKTARIVQDRRDNKYGGYRFRVRMSLQTLGSSPANDFVSFPAEWNSLNVPRATMPQIPTPARPGFLKFLADAGVKVSDEQVKPSTITPIQIEYSPSMVERAKGIPAERRVFVSADNYLLDGHHQWMAQRDRAAVNVTRIGLPVREAIATMFLFPGTTKREGAELKVQFLPGDARFITVSQDGLAGNDGTVLRSAAGRIEIKHSNMFGSPRKQSVMDFVVRENARGQGEGTRLVQEAKRRFSDIGAQVSSAASLKVFYKEGFRNPSMPDASLQEHEAARLKNGESLFVAMNDSTGNPYVRASLASSPAPDPRLVKEFGENFEADEYGMPVMPQTLPEGHPLLVPTVEKSTATIPADHPLVVGLPKDHDLAKGLPDDHPAFKGGFLQPGEMSRRAMRRGIVRFFMSYGTPLAADVKPIVYATGGGGGAGKSTVLKILRGDGRINTEGAIPVNSDDIKSLIPEYAEFMAAGDGRGAATVHEESSKTAKDLLGKILSSQQRFNFIYDATLANTDKAIRHFDEWKAAGYDVALVAVTVDPLEAITRAFLRAKESGRWVPTVELVKAHAGFNRGITRLMDAADKAYAYDNTPPKPHDIAKKSSPTDTISIVNQEYFANIKLREDEIPTRPVQSGSNQRRGDQESARGQQESRQGRDGAGQGQGSLSSSPSPELDLFGSIEAATFGPRAKVKQRAAEALRKAPEGVVKANVAKAIAKAEGLADFDLFASAAVSNLDAKPRRGESVPDGSASGQFGNAVDPRLPGRQPASRTRGTGTIGADQDLFDLASRPSGSAGGQAGGSTPSDVQGPQTRPGGSGNGSAGANPDLGGRGSDTGGSGSGEQGGNPDSGNAGKRRLTPRPRPEVGSPDRNFFIGPQTVLAEGGAITRMRNNLAAIELLRTLESQDRNATVSEKETLAKFVGWGGIPQVFDELKARAIERGEIDTRKETIRRYESQRSSWNNYEREIQRQQATIDELQKWDEKWGDHYRKLRELLSDEEWESARESVINAHYTSKTVISGMWDAVRRLGFRGGNTLEPAGGVGHYFGLMPEDMVDVSRLFGVELDSISGRIFAKLYPEADIEVTGFQDSTIPDNSQDLTISNVPFANITISDEFLDAQPDAPSFNLHNYFFERALRKTRPGGIVAFITTANTMDAQILQRKWLAERADFLGAIRLPNDAFKANANTQVVTDIIFLRKPDGSPNPMAAERWVSTQPVEVEGGKVEINEYFARHPEMILGRLANDGSMYGGKEEMTVHSNGDLAEQLQAAVANLPENVTGENAGAEFDRLSRENRGAKDGAFIEEDGKIRIKGSTEAIPAADLGRIRAFMSLRDVLNDLYAMEGDPDATDAQLATQRAKLNRAFDGFRAIYKNLHDSKNRKVLETDPDFYRTLGLEVPEGKLKKDFRKADVFTKRVLQPRVEPTSADSVEDAVLHSFRWKGRLDAGYVGKLLGVSLDEAEARLLATEFAFRDPATGKIEHASTYLAGNVRRKLRDADLAAKTNPAMQRNADALRNVLPSDVGWSDINFKMGSSWIPAETYMQFLADTLFNGRNLADVTYNPGVGDLVGDSFMVKSAGSGYGHSVDVQWGTGRKSALEIAQFALNQADPRVYDTVDKKRVYNPGESDKARAAVARMEETFLQWVAKSPELQERLHRTYNETFNSHVVPKHDGSFMQLPWVAADFDLYPDKKHVVWRALQEGSMLVAHGVGGGKTIIGTAIAMEARRLGLAKKPLIVVHNATLEQFATTISQMAPTARVFVARKDDLQGPKRKEFMGRVRSGDWDAVVMAHSTFDKIPDDPAWERKQIQDLIEELKDAIIEQGGDPDVEDMKKIKDPSVKELVKMMKRLKERMSNLQDRATDDVLTFQELGFDMMIADEAHRYKKMPFVTRQSNIAGIDTGFSQRGSAMQLRAKWIQAINNGRGVITMTGTPVTNTLGESWNMVRLVRPDLLKEFGVKTFDRFVSTFGNIKQSGELRPNGQYKPVTRLAEFTNIPEWNRFWGLAADVKMGEDMEVKGRPKIKGGKAALTVVARTPQVKAIIDEITRVIDWYDGLTGREKHANQHIPLLTYNAARMAAIDVRLINPEAKDEPTSKVNVALGNVMRLYRDTTEHKGTQVIFSDSYRPLRTTKLDLSAAEFEKQVADDETTGDEYDSGDGFNLYEDIRRKLIAMDVPASEIAIIGEMKNDKQREALFARVNSGEVRIILGSTETLGTGVNMQQRMIAAHHLDVPWTPAGLEQRDGRVYRQGNMWAELGREIEIMRYGMKDTLDAALWQKLETKERMIKQAVSGKVNVRVIEDDAGLLNLMEQKAALSGPEGMMKFTLDDKVRQLKNEWWAHRNRQFDIQRQITYAEGNIRFAAEKLPNARRVAKVVEPLVEVDPGEIEWTFEDGETLKGEDARKHLDGLFKARRKRAGEIMDPAKAESMWEPIHSTANGVPVLVKVTNISEDLANAGNPDLRWNFQWTPVFETNATDVRTSNASPHPGSVINQMPTRAQELALAPGSLERMQSQAEKDIELYRDEMGRPFGKVDEFRQSLMDQAILYRKMNIPLPEAPELYNQAYGETFEDDLRKATAKGDTSPIRYETPASYPGRGLAPAMQSLGSSPAPEQSSAVQVALAKMPAIYRQVFEAIEGGASVTEVTSRFNVTPRAVDNILNAVRSRIATAQAAAGPAGLSPVLQGDKIKGGRPDLALGAIPQVAAVDQIRNESGIPDVRGWDEVFQQARDMLIADYQGTYDMLLDKARNLQPMTDLEVAAAKSIIARETLAGKIQTPEERMKLGMLIHGYRDIGTETARSLAIRRDPHMSPAERHAQFIAEALFTPDPDTRARMRKKNASIEEIMAGWMRRVDTIKAELLAQGIDIEAALAEFNEAQEARKQAAAESPRTQAVIDEQIRKLNKREKGVIEQIRSGALVSKAAFVTGLSTDEVKAIYSRFMQDIRAAMAESAKRYLAGSLASSPADMMGSILEDLGLPDLSMIDDTVPDFVDRRGEKPRAPRKPRKPKALEKPEAPEVPGLTPEQQARLDEAFERFKNAPPSTWKTFWQTEAKNLAPMVGQTGFEAFKGKAQAAWTAEQAELFQLEREKGEVSTTTGTFDIHDPVSVKRVMDAFAIARGGKMDALMEFWKMSILTGPQTHIVNTTSNILNSAFNLLPRRATEATVNNLLGLVGQGSDKAATFGEFAPMAKNLRKGVQLAARMALRSWQAETRTFEAYARAEALQLDFTGVGAEYVPPALGGKIGKVMRSMSFRAMTAADEFLKSVYAQMETAAQAHRIAAVEEKLTGKAYEARMDELMQPGSKAWIRSIDESKRVTFQQEIDGNAPEAIRRLDQLAELAKKGRNMPWIGRPLTFFLPFIDTPLNIFKQAVELSPLGGFLAVVDMTRALKRRVFAGTLTKEEAKAEAAAIYDRARLVRDLTNQTIAWAAFLALEGLAGGDDDDDLPVITGTVPYKTTRKGERDNSYAVMPPQTIRIGGVQFSYARVEPFATVLASLVDLHVSMNRNGGFQPAVTSEWFMRFKDQVKDKTFLQGVSSLIDAIEDPDRFAERLTANIVTGFVPNVVRQPVREADATLRDTNPRADDGFFTAVSKRVGFSLAPQLAPARLDVWGNPIKSNRGAQVGGSRVTDAAFRIFDPTNAQINPQADPIDRWIFRYNLQTADSKERVAIEPISNSLSGKIPGEKRPRVFALTPAEHAEANRNAGQAAREMLGDDWQKRPLDREAAEQIMETVQKAQTIERARLRQKKLAEVMESE